MCFDSLWRQEFWGSSWKQEYKQRLKRRNSLQFSMSMSLDNSLCLLAPFREDVTLFKFAEGDVESCACQKGSANLEEQSIQWIKTSIESPTIKADMTNRVAKTARPKYSRSCFASALSAAFSCWSVGVWPAWRRLRTFGSWDGNIDSINCSI